jgi:hypothetical protein
MNTRIHTFKKYSGLFLIIFVFLSCGIEEYIYLDPVPAGNIRVTGNDNATISLPNSSSQSDYFRYYSIYYKIYLSTAGNILSISEANLRSIHPSLDSDYFAIKPYTNVSSGNTSLSPSNIEYTFRNRNYHQIAVAGTNIETLLDDTTDGKNMILDFTDTGSSDDPSLTLGGTSYNLRRSIDNPEPDDAAFQNSSDILNYGNQTDVASIAGATDCYVSLYIVKVGQDNNFSQIYSFPTFIGIFRLPTQL